MKLTVLLLISPLLQVSAKAYAQKVTIDEANISLERVFEDIRKQTGYSFIYAKEQIRETAPVTLHVKNADLQTVLRMCFKDQPLTFTIADGIIIVKQRSPDLLPIPRLPEAVTVRGQVTDSATGEPLVGVTIQIKGGVIGTTTDGSGRFSLAVPEHATLVISYVGYQKQEVMANGSGYVNIALVSSSTGLNQLVVVGYGTEKKRNMISSVSKIQGKDVSNPAYSDFTESLQGLASGVQVSTGGDGVPGAKAQIRIRGINSISNSTEPLWVIDGIPSSDSWSINPSDIESVEILKDAAGTAIYGSRASNGVILVTTKSGKAGQSLFQVDINTGVSRFANSGFKIAGTSDYLAAMDLAMQNDSRNPAAQFNPNSGFSWNTKMPTLMTREQAEQTQSDMARAVSGTGSFEDVNVSASKGSDKSNTFFSLNYRNEDGVMSGASLDRLTSRLNFGYSPLKDFNLRFRTSNSYAKGRQGASYYNAANMWTPWMPIYDTASATGYWNVAANPLAMVDRDLRENEATNIHSMSTLSLEYVAPFLQGLSFKGNIGYDYGQTRNTFWSSKYMLERNNEATPVADESRSSFLTELANIDATYDHTFGKHAVKAVFGYEVQKGTFNNMSINGKDLNGDYHQVGVPGTVVSASTGSGQSGLEAYFGRASYRFKDRYLLEGSLRTDGSSAFSPEKRWATFSSLGGGWIISDESFFHAKWVNMLKLRGSFGQTGNGDIPAYKYMNNYGIQSGTATYMNEQSSYLMSIGNSNISWETSNNKDIGVDFDLFSGRINGSVAYYRKDVNGLLLQVPLPLSAGIPGGNSIWQNIGDMKNSGIEVNITFTPVRTSNFSWEVTFNHTTNRNTVSKLHPQVDATGSGIITDRTITKKGLKLATYYLPEYAGVDPDKGIPMIWEVDQDTFDKTGKTVKTGKKIPLTSTNGAANRMILKGKSGIPDWYGGLNNTFRYKNFDLSLLLTYQGAFYYYDETLRLMREGADKGDYNIFSDLLANSWKKPGDQAKYAQLQFNGGFYYDDNGNPTDSKSGRFNGFDSRDLQRGDYLKLKNIVLAYHLPGSVLSKMRLSAVSVYAGVTNVLTFTKAMGLDPEIQLGNNIDGLIGGYNMPTTRTYSFGLSVKF